MRGYPQIDDYPLFPAGEFGPDDVAPFRRDVKPWGYRQFLGDPHLGSGYYAIERAAEIPYVPGRGPYAMKYVAADLVPMVAGTLAIADAAAINLATAHDTPGTATQYRQKLRTQPGVLVNVGRILWEIRKELRRLASAGEDVRNWGIDAADERIARYRVGEGGVKLQTVLGEVVWVPWMGLVTVGRQDFDAVSRMMGASRIGRSPQLDDEARELLFPGGVTLKLDEMLLRAREPGEKSENDPELWRRWDP